MPGFSCQGSDHVGSDTRSADCCFSVPMQNSPSLLKQMVSAILTHDCIKMPRPRHHENKAMKDTAGRATPSAEIDPVN
jgi:hypothetical protein